MSAKKRLFTIEGCNSCESLKKQFAREITSGKLTLIHCNPEGTKRERKNCELIPSLENFDGFPSIYDKNGKKII